jgi:Holliday junction resolvase
MLESDYNAEFVRRWREKSPTAWVYKIPDTMGIGAERPFDVVALDGGTAYAIENKLHKTHRSFPLSKVEPHQLLNLRLAEANGAIARVRVAVRIMLDVTTQRRLEMRKRRFSFDLEYTTAQILDLQRLGVKSVEILPYLRKLDAKPSTADDEP